MTIWMIAGIAVYVLGWALDTWTTNKFLANYNGIELNPIIKFFMEKLGNKWCLVKAVPLVAIILLFVMSMISPTAFIIATVGGGVVQILAGLHNLRLLWKAGEFE